MEQEHYFSGCNYYVNRGQNKFEPVGTATSMHDCDGCKSLDYCKVKQKTEVWKYNDEIAEQLKKGWEETLNINFQKICSPTYTEGMVQRADD